MADGLSIVASIIAVIQLTTKAVSLSYGYIGGVAQAPDDFQKLLAELKSLTKALTALHLCAQANPGSRSTALQELEDPLRQCLQEIGRLQLRLEPKKWWRKTLARLQWPLEAKETSDFISRIERHKSLFVLVLDTIQL